MQLQWMTSNVPSSPESLCCCLSVNKCWRAVDLGLSVVEHLTGPAVLRACPAAPSGLRCWLLSCLRVRGWRKPSQQTKWEATVPGRMLLLWFCKWSGRKLKAGSNGDASLGYPADNPETKDTEPKSLFSPRLPLTPPGPPAHSVYLHSPGT